MSQSLNYQIVARAREIIVEPEHWLQGELAIAADRMSVDPTDPRAERFCVVGALRRAAHEIAPAEKTLADRVQDAIETYVHLHHPALDDSLEDLNDDGDHATVVRLFDEFLAADMT
jgi:hypothetical protein